MNIFCGTAESGYFNKKIAAAFQGVVLDTIGSDCKTNNTLEVIITDKTKNDFMYRYILDGSKLVLLTGDNINKYINKKIKLRSPVYCVGDKLCNKCAGDLYYKLGVVNVGLATTRVASTLLNMSMKKFHNSTANVSKINLNEIII